MKERPHTGCLWVICDDDAIQGRIESTLEEDHVCLRMHSRATVTRAGFWRESLTLPGAVLLDLADDLDGGARVLRDIKSARVRAPVIVLSKEFNTEFGNKIVSEGASYFLPRDFDAEEFREVVRALLKPAHRPSG